MECWCSGPFVNEDTNMSVVDKEKKLVAFGYDAENQYADLVMDKEHDDYYFFHRFKMNLHNNKVFYLFF